MTTLVTGGTGSLGLELARLLARQDEELVLFDAAPRQRLAELLAPRATVVRGDLSNWSDVVAVLRRYAPRRIFHLAALLPVSCERNPAAAYAVNVQGTFHVLEAARLLGPCAIILASSAAAVGRPSSMYGATKRSAEALARAYHGREGLDVRGARLLPLMGLSLAYVEPPTGRASGEREQFLYGRLATIASVMMQEAAGHRPWDVPAPRDVPLYAIYRRDAARALTMLAEADGTRLRQRIYNVSGAEPMATLGSLAAALQAAEPAASFTFDDDPATAQRVAAAHEVTYADGEAREDWDWEASFTAEAVAHDAVGEARQHPHLYANRRP